MTDFTLENRNVSLPRDQVDAIYREAVQRYIDARRLRVDGFVEQHFSFRGSLLLHRHAVGWDMLKAPVNAVASALTVAKYLGSKVVHVAGGRQTAERLSNKNLFVETQLGKELESLIRSDLLEITWGMESTEAEDALMIEICKDPLVEKSLAEAMVVLAQMQDQNGFQEKLTNTLQAYVGSRSAASDISVSLLSVAAGMAVFHKVTPGLTALTASVSSSLASAIAAQSFWAGPWAGSLYYSIVGVTTPKLMMLGVFTGLLVPASIIATFSGLVTDPLQKSAGLHHRRLHKVIDTVELQLLLEDEKEISFKDHYVARVLDLLDITQSIVSLGR